ncbi:hypothetical protein FRB96_004188 [Tulasnella sp. 330]|nr:hypothetical protein FRB96_004188 [Tulasnella sp. 330]KAG8873383.1 hypothetical protein FRB97_006792 [Tulasnella sp. 331]KAG8888171.1 hypothetical protein FRB98_008282 [Tulasnella sp. 332]
MSPATMDWHDCVQRLFTNPDVIRIAKPFKSVGGGGSCDLYRGTYKRTGLQLALKRPRFSIQSSQEAEDTKRRFRREGKIWSTLLYHVNVVPFLGVVDIADETYLVSPWLDHGDLARFVPERLRFLELPEGERSAHPSRAAFEKFDEEKIIAGIASGLAYLHDHSVIHGDIKAANVLLDAEIRPALSDFGLTKVLDGLSATSNAMKGAGSTRWMSPELLNNSPRSRESDIYALGMTITEILTGRLPFPDLVNPGSVIYAIMTGQRPPTEPVSRNGKSFRDIWILATSCWHSDPAQRPSSRSIGDTIKRAPLLAALEIDSDIISDQATVQQAAEQHKSTKRQPRAMESKLPAVQRTSPHLSLSSGPPTPEKDIPHPSTQKPEARTRNGERHAPMDLYDQDFQNSHVLEYSQKPRYPPSWLTSNSSLVHGIIPGPSISAKPTKASTEAPSLHATPVAPRRATSNHTRTPSPRLTRLEDATSLKAIGDSHQKQGLYTEARTAYEKSSRAYQELGNRLGVANCLEGIGDSHLLQGRYDEARIAYKKASRAYQELEDSLGTANCLKGIGDVHWLQDRYDEARESYGKASRGYQEVGDRLGMAGCLKGIGEVHRLQGRYDEARQTYKTASDVFHELGDRLGMANCLWGIGDVYRLQGRQDEAQEEYELASRAYQEVGDRRGMANCMLGIAHVHRAQGRFTDALEVYEAASQVYQNLGDRVGMANCMWGIGGLHRVKHRYHEARTSYSEAKALYEEMGMKTQSASCSRRIHDVSSRIAYSAS